MFAADSTGLSSFV